MESSISYPSVTKRVKAIFLDALIMIVFMAIIANIFAMFENIPDFITVLLFVFVFLLYDPIMVCVWGGTIGHLSNGMRVKRYDDQNKNLIFFTALIRFLIKSFLGWITFVPAFNNTEARSMHDMASGSIVIFAP